MKYITVGGLAEHLSVSASTIRQWVKIGRIPKSTYLKVGATYRFDVAAVEDALRNFEGDVLDSEPNIFALAEQDI